MMRVSAAFVVLPAIFMACLLSTPPAAADRPVKQKRLLLSLGAGWGYVERISEYEPDRVEGAAFPLAIGVEMAGAGVAYVAYEGRRDAGAGWLLRAALGARGSGRLRMLFPFELAFTGQEGAVAMFVGGALEMVVASL